DQFNSPAITYTGTVHFQSTDLNANVVLPADLTLVNGTATFTAKLITATRNGITPTLQTITVSDTVTSAISGSAAITVNPGAATHFSVAAPATVSAGDLFVYSVVALDSFNNTATGYAGTVTFSSGDPQKALPLPKTLTSGTGSFAASLR